MADIKGLSEYIGNEPDPRMEPSLGHNPPPRLEPFLSRYKAEEAARKAEERPTQVRDNWQNMVENSLLKIMKYGSDIKPADVGMTRRNAMQDMEKEAPTAAETEAQSASGMGLGSQEITAQSSAHEAANLLAGAVAGKKEKGPSLSEQIAAGIKTGMQQREPGGATPPANGSSTPGKNIPEINWEQAETKPGDTAAKQNIPSLTNPTSTKTPRNFPKIG